MTQAEYGILYFELNALSFIIIWIILHKTNGLSKMVAQRNFAMSIVAEMIFIASDTIYVMAHNGVIYLGFLDRYVRLMCKEVYFFSTSMMCFFWFIYFEYMRDTDFVKEKKKVNFASLIMWAMGLLLVINLFNGFLFYIDGDGVYHRGQFFILTYILSYSYVIIAYIRTICGMLDKSYTGDKHTLVLLIVFPAVPGLAGIIQFVYPRIPVACAMLAITTLLLYLNWIDQLISLDPLTGLNNRKQLGHFYNNWMKNHNEGDTINVLMIDANKFKSINDTYGHVQGDKALKNIAESLKLGCRALPKRANIARYGGDEFAILYESSNPEDADHLRKSITEQLAKIN